MTMKRRFVMVTHLHVGFKVKNYDDWKQGYDASKDERREAGELAFKVYRNVDDPDTVTVLSVQKDAEKIKAFINSPHIKELMMEAGVKEMGQMFILEEMDSGTF
jgi:quinol monooxygenase YgiN